MTTIVMVLMTVLMMMMGGGELVTGVDRYSQRTTFEHMWILSSFVVASAITWENSSPNCLNISSSSLTLSFDSAPIDADLHYVELRAPKNGSRPFAVVTTRNFPVEINGLSPETMYRLSIRSHPSEGPPITWGPSWLPSSRAVDCTTAAPEIQSISYQDRNSKIASKDSRFLRAYRISEYSFKPDFLRNHNAADRLAMPLYLMTCDNSGDCAPWSATNLTPNWNACQAAMSRLCPDQRGKGFECMSCADANRAEVESVCGGFSDGDTTEGEGSFGVHWHCGVGWPESSPEEGVIQEFCIEYYPSKKTSPQKAGRGGAGESDGFSFYLSCNSDETSQYGSTAREPKCICQVKDDRMLSHQTSAELARDCPSNQTIPWVNETVCNCPDTSSPIPSSSSDSVTHIGRSPVYLPYVGVELGPCDPPECVSIPSGFNYHFPASTACDEDALLGSEGCTWKRTPTVRMIYGSDLISAGWNRSFVPDTNTDTNHTQANIRAFQRAVKALDELITITTNGCTPG
eukprot:jgi/Bigna1/88157/estExt_fgenesh1_pg.C_280189